MPEPDRRLTAEEAPVVAAAWLSLGDRLQVRRSEGLRATDAPRTDLVPTSRLSADDHSDRAGRTEELN